MCVCSLSQMEVDGFCNALHILVSPDQLNKLVEMATEVSKDSKC